MTSLSIDDVRHVARLARLGLDEPELAQMAGDLLVGFAQSHHQAALDAWMPQFGRSPEQALANAPDPEDGCFRVPRMLS